MGISVIYYFYDCNACLLWAIYNFLLPKSKEFHSQFNNTQQRSKRNILTTHLLNFSVFLVHWTFYFYSFHKYKLVNNYIREITRKPSPYIVPFLNTLVHKTLACTHCFRKLIEVSSLVMYAYTITIWCPAFWTEDFWNGHLSLHVFKSMTVSVVYCRFQVV
jgi:hypothetical protein